MKNRLAVLFIGLAILTAAAASRAQDPLTPADLQLDPRLPVVGQTVEIGWSEDQITGPARVELRDRSGETVHTFEAAENDAIRFEWTPKTTGFYELVLARGEKTLFRYQLPVVWRELHFAVWPRLTPDDRGKLKYLTTTVLLQKDSHIPDWQRYGAKVINPVYYRHRKHIDSDLAPEAMAQRLAERWGREMKKGVDGLFIDELGAYPDSESLDRIEIENKALRILRREYPEALLFPAVGGATLREQAVGYKKAGAVAMLETYGEYLGATFGSHSFKRRIDHRVQTVRNTDLIFERGYGTDTSPGSFKQEGAIILLSINHVVGVRPEPTLARLEDEVRYIKKTAPEMPGIAFYGLSQARQFYREAGILQGADRLIEQYYIKPVVDLRNVILGSYEPQAGEPTTIHPVIHNTGGMDAHDVTADVYVEPTAGGKREKVGTLNVETIGTGFARLTTDTEEAFEYQQFNGNRYAVSPGSRNIVERDRHIGSIPWTPEKPGYYRITVEVRGSDQYTLLDGMQELTVPVR